MTTTTADRKVQYPGGLAPPPRLHSLTTSLHQDGRSDVLILQERLCDDSGNDDDRRKRLKTNNGGYGEDLTVSHHVLPPHQHQHQYQQEQEQQQHSTYNETSITVSSIVQTQWTWPSEPSVPLPSLDCFVAYHPQKPLAPSGSTGQFEAIGFQEEILEEKQTQDDKQEEVVCYGLLHNLDHFQLSFEPSTPQELRWADEAGCIYIDGHSVKLSPRTATILVELGEEACTAFDLILDYSQEEQTTHRAKKSKDGSTSNSYALSVVLYGLASAADAVGDWLDSVDLYLQTPRHCTWNVRYCNPHRMTDPNSQPIMTSQLVANAAAGDPETIPGADDEDQDAHAHAHALDPSEIYTSRLYQEASQPRRLQTSLHKHQRQALSFMQGRERGWDLHNERSTNDLWQTKHDCFGHEYYVEVLSGQRHSRPPPDFRGGILADDMGLGKTCSMLSLIVAEDDDIETLVKTDLDWSARTTLIVVPLPLLQVWEKQIHLHLVPGLTRSIVYYGPSRQLIGPFTAYDIVITTYNTVAAEWKAAKAKDGATTKSPCPLLKTPWHRIVLDEAHIVKNRNTAIAKAVSALTGERRWCITGTPIQNRSSDLYSLLRFLKLAPYDDLRTFERLFVEPWKQSLSSTGLHNLQSIFRAIAIRRPKATIPLPPKQELIQQVNFGPEEHETYERTKKGVVEIIDAAVMQCDGDGGRSYFNTLQRINDLRYICNHGVKPLKKSTLDPRKLSICGQSDSLLGANAITTCDLCGNELLDDQETEDTLQVGGTPTSTTEAFRTCIACTRDAHSSSSFSTASPTSADSGASSPDPSLSLSSKVRSLVQAVQSVPAWDKCVVFSYWTSSLDLVGRTLSYAGITCTRYIGSMSRRKRDNILREFAENGQIKVILVSISCGGTGLDLTAANHAFLLEPQWNPMLEEQAMSRIHRIGQEKPVRLVRLIVKDTWEEKIVTLQHRKRLLARLIVDGEHVGKADDGRNRLLLLKDLIT